MRALVPLLVLVVFLCGIAYAADFDESKLSPEAKALKAKYDAQIKKLQEDFQNELAKLAAGEPIAPPKTAWYDNIKVGGYFHAQFYARSYDNPAARDINEFDIRRLYVALAAPLGDTTTANLLWAGCGPNFRAGSGLTSTTDWANIFVDFKPAPEWTIRLGQAPTWFGIDVKGSSAVRLTPERFAGGEGLGNLGLLGLYFAGPWDRGLWVINDQRVHSEDKTGLLTVVSVHNGNFRNSDDDNHKNVSADLEYFTEWGQFGVSWLDGTFGGGDRNAVGVNLRLFPNVLVPDWGFQAEYLEGEWMGADKEAWYGQASYHFDKDPAIAYVRYEEFDPDTDIRDNAYSGLHVGYKYNLTPKDQVTLEYTKGEVGNDDADDMTVQYQRVF